VFVGLEKHRRAAIRTEAGTEFAAARGGAGEFPALAFDRYRAGRIVSHDSKRGSGASLTVETMAGNYDRRRIGDVGPERAATATG